MDKREPYFAFKGWLSSNGISQTEVANALKTSPNYLNKKINGYGPDFKLSEVRKINKVFGTPVDIFFKIKVPLKERNGKE